MGNSSTKEERRTSPTFPRTLSGGRPGPSHPGVPYGPDAALLHAAERARLASASGREFAQLFGVPPPGSGSSDADGLAYLERRRETRAEREAKRVERERVNRERERERSMREESVDGGYLVTQGVYTGIEDYSKPIVRQLMIERRLAPFWPGLNDHSEAWAEHQLVAAVRGLPIPAADAVPEQPTEGQDPTEAEQDNQSAPLATNLMIPVTIQSPLAQDDTLHLSTSTPNPVGPISSSPPSSLLRGRAKTLATLTPASRAIPSADLQPREMHLPKDPTVNGQPIEAHLYKDATECPICFLYYPPFLNRTRCCDQPICSECFVQIKRPDPHPPEHPDPNDPQHANEQAQEQDGQLVSEPSQCPYCAQPELGVTYEPLPFRRGLTYAHPGAIAGTSAAMSSSSSLNSATASGQRSPAGNRRRATSLAANAPQVISTDMVRPDWAAKLASARAHQARRSAAATALHTAAYLMGGRSGATERSFPGFGRRVIMRRATGEGGQGFPPGLVGYPGGPDRWRVEGGEDSQPDASPDSAPMITGPPRISSRRDRVDDLEEMMMMEAIRLSLASEEERRKKEEKEARKEAKKRAKEDKKAEKAARKAGIYAAGVNKSSGTLDSPSSGSLAIDSSGSKGKSVARDGDESESSQLSRSAPYDIHGESAQSYLERSRAQLKPEAGSSVPYRPSHLRNLSNISSDVSSLADESVEPSPRYRRGDESGAAGSDVETEPMFNFRSLTAMIDSEGDKTGAHAEHDEGLNEKHSGGSGTAAGTHLASDSDDAGEGGLEQSVSTLTPENVRIATAIDVLGGDEDEIGSAR